MLRFIFSAALTLGQTSEEWLLSRFLFQEWSGHPINLQKERHIGIPFSIFPTPFQGMLGRKGLMGCPSVGSLLPWKLNHGCIVTSSQQGAGVCVEKKERFSDQILRKMIVWDQPLKVGRGSGFYGAVEERKVWKPCAWLPHEESLDFPPPPPLIIS